MATRKLTIDKEFAGLCPDLTTEEATQLEASIAADGCRDEIVVWANHKDTILDGHHRYEICDRLGKTFKTTALRFETREECIEWIIANQLGRRNLTDEQKSYLRGKRYQAEKRTDGGHGDQKSGDHSDTPIPTAAKLAEEYGVSAPTIKRDQDFAEAVDTIAEVAGPEAKAEILSGESPLGKAAVVKAAKLPKAKMATALKTGKLPAAPKSGAQKKDPRLWGEIEGLLGKALNRTDELNRHFPHGNLHRKLIGEIKTPMATLKEWKQAART
jgi:hypothetical protein